MELTYKILLGLTVFVAVMLSLIIFVTGKGDAMSGGASSVRTTFKGKASFEDQMSRFTLFLAIGFMGLCVILDVVAHRR